MGLLSAQGAQDWHLAPSSLREACVEANDYLTTQRSTTLQSVALGFGLNSSSSMGCNTVVGCTIPQHVYELMERWKSLYADNLDGGLVGVEREEALNKQREDEESVKAIIRKTGLLK